MHIDLLLLLALSWGGAARAQDAAQAADKPVHVRKMTLTASDLAESELQPIAASLEGGTYTVDALHDRIELKLHDDGYYFAHAAVPQLADVRQEGAARSADVSVAVQAGSQYRMGEISFRGTTAFPKERMRSAFPIRPAAFSAQVRSPRAWST